MLEKNKALLEELESMEKGGKIGKVMLHWSNGVVRTIDVIRSAPVTNRKILSNGKFVDSAYKNNKGGQ